VCGEDCQGCDDFTPADDLGCGEREYEKILRENAEVYQNMVDDYSDGGMSD
jgi:hypothetical protein